MLNVITWPIKIIGHMMRSRVFCRWQKWRYSIFCKFLYLLNSLFLVTSTHILKRDIATFKVVEIVVITFFSRLPLSNNWNLGSGCYYELLFSILTSSCHHIRVKLIEEMKLFQNPRAFRIHGLCCAPCTPFKSDGYVHVRNLSKFSVNQIVFQVANWIIMLFLVIWTRI